MLPRSEQYAVCMSLSHFPSSFCPFDITISVSSLTQRNCSTTMCDFFVFSYNCHFTRWPVNIKSCRSSRPILKFAPTFFLNFSKNSGVPVVNNSSTRRQHIPMVFLPLAILPCTGSMKCSSNSSTRVKGVSCGTVARYVLSAGGNIDTSASASSSGPQGQIDFSPSSCQYSSLATTIHLFSSQWKFYRNVAWN